MASLMEITEQNFEQEVMRSDLPVLLEFGAEWCGPCKQVAPELEALSLELQGKAKVVKVDIDKAPILAREFGVRSVPTFVVLHQGRPVTGQVGALRKAQLLEMLEPVLPRAAGALKPEELAPLVLQGRATPVDLREAPVFARAHLPRAVSVPEAEVEERASELLQLKGAPVLYCRTGDRSKEVASKLTESGIAVSYLEGGVLGWEGSGLELERPD